MNDMYAKQGHLGGTVMGEKRSKAEGEYYKSTL
jgi:hypothetical protein